MFEVTYYDNGRQFTLKLTRDEAVKEIKSFGCPISKNPADKEISKFLNEIYG